VYEKTNKTTVISQREDIGLQMHVDKDGIVKEGSLRTISPLRITTDQMRKRLKEANIPILEGHTIHHKIPITAAEKDPLAKAARELGYDVNNAGNLKQLPGSSAAREKATESLVLPEHGEKNFHPEWITHTKIVLQKTLDKLVEYTGAPGGLSPS
jgi:A nuclease family of the HNH/ENDO VII superfamily with conserved AHH